jgi:hypothetical protein
MKKKIAMRLQIPRNPRLSAIKIEFLRNPNNG